MSDEKCKHPETRIELTKSGVKRVCKICGRVVKDLADEVVIEKVILPIPDVEKGVYHRASHDDGLYDWPIKD